MRFRIPFTFSGTEKLKKQSSFFSSKISHKKSSKLEDYLRNCDIDITREEYLGICARSFLVLFIFFYVLFTTLFAILSIENFYLISMVVALLFSGMIYIVQVNFPKMYVNRKQKDIDRNLISALEDIVIQLNSGVSLFNILANISSSDYGFLSFEFKKAVKRIGSGESETEVLNIMAIDNPSVLFRRTLWQIRNGMIAGSDMSIVVKDTIRALNEEQLLEIQNYGSSLNPIIVMYMLLTVIIPTLSIAFLTIIASMVSLGSREATMLFLTLFVIVILAQVMFLGLIKSKRPRLL